MHVPTERLHWSHSDTKLRLASRPLITRRPFVTLVFVVDVFLPPAQYFTATKFITRFSADTRTVKTSKFIFPINPAQISWSAPACSPRTVPTCLSICAAMWWLQSKMMRTSRPLFISLRRGLVSWVSRGSWRILSLMLYLDGAIISSCSLIRPKEEKEQDPWCMISLKMLWHWGRWYRAQLLTDCLFLSGVLCTVFYRIPFTLCNSVIVSSPVLSSYTTVADFHLRYCTRSRIA